MNVEERKTKIFKYIEQLQELEDSLPDIPREEFLVRYEGRTVSGVEQKINLEIDEFLHMLEYIDDPAIELVLKKLG